MISTSGKVYEQRGITYVTTIRPAEDNLADDVLVVWHDSRMISEDQRRKAYALVGEITAWAGYMNREREIVNGHLKQRFLLQQIDEYQRQMFSLSDCSMTMAREYISWLIDFCLQEDVPTRMPLMDLADDLEKYTYACLLHKKCCICGRKAELHHCEGSMIGMGYNRQTKPQIGNLILPLCREHHMEYHRIGRKEFEDKYHLAPVPMDERLAKAYGLSKKARQSA